MAVKITYAISEELAALAAEQLAAGSVLGEDSNFHDWAVVALDGPDIGIQALRLGGKVSPKGDTGKFLHQRLIELGRRLVDSPAEGGGVLSQLMSRGEAVALLRASEVHEVANLLETPLPHGWGWLMYIWNPATDSGDEGWVTPMAINYTAALESLTTELDGLDDQVD